MFEPNTFGGVGKQTNLLSNDDVLTHAFVDLDVMYTNAHAAILLVQRLKVVGVRLTAAQRAARDPRAKPLDSAMRLGTGQQLPGPADLVGRRYTCVSTW